jgi:hypothetical protein
VERSTSTAIGIAASAPLPNITSPETTSATSRAISLVLDPSSLTNNSRLPQRPKLQHVKGSLAISKGRSRETSEGSSLLDVHGMVHNSKRRRIISSDDEGETISRQKRGRGE